MLGGRCYFHPTTTVTCLRGINYWSMDDDYGQYFLLSIGQDSTPSSFP